MDYLNAQEASLGLDGREYSDSPDLFNSAVFLYNYILNCGAAAELTAEDLMPFAEDTGNLETEAQTALDNIQSLTNE